jgi:hypothetical protein
MIESVDAECLARLHCHDAVGREFDVLHFVGSDLLSLSLARTRDRRLHLTPRMAMKLAVVLDQFARHRVLRDGLGGAKYEI